MKLQAKQASDQLTMKIALLKLMGEAELNQAQIQKLEAEVEEIKIGIVTEGERMRIQEINMQIGLQRERREGVMNAIKTMNTAFDKMVVGTQENLGQPNMEMPQLPQ
jgi:hypothetical protein